MTKESFIFQTSENCILCFRGALPSLHVKRVRIWSKMNSFYFLMMFNTSRFCIMNFWKSFSPSLAASCPSGCLPKSPLAMAVVVTKKNPPSPLQLQPIYSPVCIGLKAQKIQGYSQNEVLQRILHILCVIYLITENFWEYKNALLTKTTPKCHFFPDYQSNSFIFLNKKCIIIKNNWKITSNSTT